MHRVDASGRLENNPVSRIEFSSDHHIQDFLLAASDALLLRNGVRIKNAHPAACDLRNMGIPEIARNLLRLSNDYNASGYSNRDAVIKAMHSTSDFPLLLANTGGKSLREGYMIAPITCREWTSEREVPDFKEQTLAKLSEAPELLEVREGGEYMHRTFGESADKFKIKKWGRIFSITREALVNDDLSAFTRLPFAFGQRSAALESDEVYSLLTSTANLADGSPLFDSSRGNLAASGAALSVSALGAARAAMRKQTGFEVDDFSIKARLEFAAAVIDPKALYKNPGA